MGKVTEVHALNVLVDVDFENFFLNFCDGRSFLKESKQGKGLD